MTPQEQRDTVDESYDGYYYDAEAGRITTITVSDGCVELCGFGEETPYYTYDTVAEFDLEDEDITRVPDFAVNNPIEVAEAIYQNGYGGRGDVVVNGNLCSVPAIEFVDRVTEFTVTEELQ